MTRFLNNELTLLALVAEECQYDSNLGTLLVALKDLSAYCNTWFTNEKSIYSDLARCGTECAILVYLNEKSLINTRFRQLFTTLVGTNLKIIIVKNTEPSKDVIISYFPYVAKLRLKKIMNLVNEAIIVNSQNALLSIIIRLQQLVESLILMPVPGYKGKKKSFFFYKDNNFFSLRDKQVNNPCICTCNPVKEARVTTNKNNYSGPFAVKKPINEKKYLKTAKKVQNISNKKPLICPTIKISTSDINYKLQRASLADEFESMKTSTESESPNMKHLDNIGNSSGQVEKMLSADHPDMRSIHHIPLIKEFFLEKDAANNEKSCQQLPKTYVLFDPCSNSKNLLYVNIPHVDNLHLNDVDHRRSRETSPRSSMLFNSMSSEDFNNIDTAYDCVNLFESPIPTPDIKIKSIYRKPIPSFSQEMCFPPVGLFPCEILQVKRPSIFDCLRM
ncbi:uncharacterized protein LOC136086711 [Hydra vulgaris]|uniref:Uncharacterized protein LOC136086711 n=1 Tax=Hydra vulgaris TaxID=6087 RepID=A0ABM4CT34_HYDVU